ncbi:MAG: tetratricopeptide repeat-containing sulfotransferase family protein, partial [Alphaproteobacteria bacterium]
MNSNHQDPRLKEALFLKNSGKSEDATRLIQTILQENIENPDALQILGQITYEDSNYDIAYDLYRESLKLDPEQAHVWNHLGQVLNDLRKPEEAEEAFRKSIELNPELARPLKNLANIYLNRGDREEGIKLARKALEVNPGFMGTYLILAKAKAFKPDDPATKKIEKFISRNQENPGALGILHYALSYIYEQAGDSEKFFFHLNKANEYNRSPDGEWKTKLTSKIENIKSIMTPEFLAEKVSERHKIYTPIFIVGLPRSGTSLTDQIFATHSQCFGGDELQYFAKYLTRVTRAITDDPQILSYPKLGMEHLVQIATLYQQRVQTLAPGTPFISDKMLWNFQNIGMISKILPWAKIIHIYRDPLDNGFSNYRSPLSKNLEFTCDMEDYAFYRSKYQELMDFWQETIPERFINLSYEKLV